MIYILLPLAAVSAALHIRGEYSGRRQQVYMFKPLTMVIIFLIALLGQEAAPAYRYLILGGLIASIGGDVFLMLPSDRFVAGLVAFLIAHLFYIAAFASEITVLVWWPLIPLAAFGLIFYLILAGSLGKMQLPVLVYIIVILLMTWLACTRLLQPGEAVGTAVQAAQNGVLQAFAHAGPAAQSGAFLACIGAVLFVISDAVLALNRFKGSFRAAALLNLSTYFAAQALIAGSLGLLA